MTAAYHPLQSAPSRTADWATTAATASAVCLLFAGVWLGHSTLQGVIQCFALDDTVAESQLAVTSVRSTLKDAETGQRGYLVTHDESYLAPYISAQERIGLDLALLDRASLGDPERTRRISHIRELATAKMAELAKTLALAKSGHGGAAVAEVRTNLGRDEMNGIRSEVDALTADAAARVADARVAAKSVTRWAGVIGFSGIAAMLMGWVAMEQRNGRLQTMASLSKLDRFTRAFGLTQGIMLDLEGRIIFWSVGAERLYGYSRREAMGQFIHALLRTSFQHPLAEIEINAAVLRDGHWSGELEHYHRNGTQVSVASQWSLYHGEAGEAATIIKVNNDITQLKHTEANLRHSEVILRLALAASDQGVWQWNIGSAPAELECDARCKALVGLPLDAPVSYAAWVDRVHSEDRTMAEASLSAALDPMDPDDNYASAYRICHSDGTVRWLAGEGRALFESSTTTPAQRQAVCIIGTLRDVSAAKSAEQERERAATLLRTIVETVPGRLYAKDWQGRMLVANGLAMDVIGKPWSEVAGRTAIEFLHDRGHAEEVMQTDRRIIEQGKTETVEESVTTPEGQADTWLSTRTPLRGVNGQIIGLVGLSIEITERKRLEDRMQLMIDELNHRVKNTLMTVQAIALQTLAGVAPEIRQVLEDRLLAVASAHEILTRENWEGAGLPDVVAAALIPFQTPGRIRFRTSGPGLQLRPRASLALAMGLHELATNSLKYGALSAETGLVEIQWEVAEANIPKLCLTWTERGGPPVVPPSRAGFGTRMIERTLAQDLGGTTQISFDNPAGVMCHVEAPLAQVRMTAAIGVLPRVGMMLGERSPADRKPVVRLRIFCDGG